MTADNDNAPALLEQPGARDTAQEAMTMQNDTDRNGRSARRRPGVPATGVRFRRGHLRVPPAHKPETNHDTEEAS